MTSSQIQNVSLTEALKGRVIVSDTSSLLIAGTYLLELLDDCQLVIPVIVVKELEEKRNHATLGFLAREWLRLIESYRILDIHALTEGVELEGYSNVRLRVEPNHSKQESLPTHLQDGSHDSTILAVAVNLKKDYDKEAGKDTDTVVILSNDMPMRLHATLELNIEAYEYVNGNDGTPFIGSLTLDIPSEDEFELDVYSDKINSKLKKRVLENLPAGVASTSYTELLLDGESTKVAVLVSNGEVRKVSHKSKVSGVTGKNLEQNVLLSMLAMGSDDLPVVSVGGGAGTGKTLLTVATALSELKAGRYEKIMVFRSLHEMGVGQEMGFLPGNVDEKIAPWAGAVYDAIDTIVRLAKPVKKNDTVVDIEKRKTEAQKIRDMMEISPITYLRGRSLNNTFMILEEAQNFSRSEILNILSRAGTNTKIVLTWDANQTDNRFLKTGKNADIWGVVDVLKDLDIFGHITLTKTERSKVAEITSNILENQQ